MKRKFSLITTSASLFFCIDIHPQDNLIENIGQEFCVDLVEGIEFLAEETQETQSIEHITTQNDTSRNVEVSNNTRAAARLRAKYDAQNQVFSRHFNIPIEQLKSEIPEHLFDGYEIDYPPNCNAELKRRLSVNKAQKKARTRRKYIRKELEKKFYKLPPETQKPLNQEIQTLKEKLFQEYLVRNGLTQDQ